jgi:hypothetical protein
MCAVGRDRVDRVFFPYQIFLDQHFFIHPSSIFRGIFNGIKGILNFREGSTDVDVATGRATGGLDDGERGGGGGGGREGRKEVGVDEGFGFFPVAG